MRARAVMGAAVAAGFGAALVAGPAAWAVPTPGPLGIYTAESSARGIDLSLAVKPMIFDPLVQAVAGFTRTKVTSVPESTSLASLLYPGDLPQSVLDEDGTAANSGLPFSWPFTLKGTLQDPNKQEREREFGATPLLSQLGVTKRAGYMRVVAKEFQNGATAVFKNLIVRPNAEAAPLLSVDELRVDSDLRNAGSLVQVATSRASGVTLVGGTIRMDSITSAVRVVSDGTVVPEISSAITMKGVEVQDAEGNWHRARIDEHSIHIDDPALGREAQHGLDQKLQLALGEAGVTIQTLETTTITDGPTGEAIAGGLAITIRTGTCEVCYTILGQLPSIPPEIGEQIPDIRICQAPSPVCVSPGLIPFPADYEIKLTVGAARALASGGHLLLIGEPCLPPSCGGGPPGGTTGVTTGFPATTGFSGTGPPPPGSGALPGGTTGAIGGGSGGPLVGLVARLPASALVWAGASVLVLAVGLALGPSLRRGAG